ncbi:MAG: hypothetical protein M1379_13490 [Firmicutes bacterium]|nr:hypothetical protein [Bacillota bacterium]
MLIFGGRQGAKKGGEAVLGRVRMLVRILMLLVPAMVSLHGAGLLAGVGIARAAYATDAPVIVDVRTDQVTYQTLTPAVTVSVIYKRLGAARDIAISLVEPVYDRILATKVVQPTRDYGTVSATFSVAAPHMQGLAAVGTIRDEEGKPWVTMARPFVVTDDIRRNFYWGEPSRAPETDWPITPRDAVEARYQAFRNVLEFQFSEFRGHYTPWEERGPFWWYSNEKGYEKGMMSEKNIQEICDYANSLGIMPQGWFDPWGYLAKPVGYQGRPFISEDNPWVNEDPKAYRGGDMAMSLKWDMDRPLSEKEQKTMASNTHGARSWFDYLLKEYTLAIQHFGFGAMWFDNWQDGRAINMAEGDGKYTKYRFVERLLPAIKKELGRPGFIIMANAGKNSLLQPEDAPAGRLVDLFWHEFVEPRNLADMLSLLRMKVTDQEKEWGYRFLSYIAFTYEVNSATDDDPVADEIIFNPAYAYVYRQQLFEIHALSPDIVGGRLGRGQGRYDLERLYALAKMNVGAAARAWAEHRKTWAFETQFAHLLNSADIEGRSGEDVVSLAGARVSYDDLPKADTVHVRANVEPEKHRYLVHFFNYVGSETTVQSLRPEPKPVEVTATVKVDGDASGYKVYLVSPDHDRYLAVDTPAVSAHHGEVTFKAPLRYYTLAVIEPAKMSERRDVRAFAR